ncbi:MAG: BlaI/MecI/CopY family transcriptional regulator [Defluviitaleaceae bacterium]|nr:BlaI/MecI/CopY family transcriptional regulator [Defluviitaleaceae bacterium]
MQQVSDYELEVMKIIWTNGGTALYAEIVAGLEAKNNSLTKNTVLTLLSRLADKGILKTSKTGRRNIYTAAVTENDYQTHQTIRFLNKVYEGSTKGLVSTLIAKDLLSRSDYDELLNQWSGGVVADE